MMLYRKGKPERMSKAPFSKMGDGWPVPQIDPIRCDGCGLCVKVCPSHALKLIEGLADVAFPTRCNYSGLCEQVCPENAIERIFIISLPGCEG